MHLGTKVCKRAAAVSAVAAGLTGAVAVVPATAATKRPPCTRTALAAGLKRGSEKQPGGRIPKKTFGCAGRYAYAAVVFRGIEYTQVFRASGTRWVTINRTKPCKKKTVPKKIYKPACLTS